MMMRTKRPTVAGTKYMSATDTGVAVGEVAVAVGDPTVTEVSEDEP